MTATTELERQQAHDGMVTSSATTPRSGMTVIVPSVVGDTGSAGTCGRGCHVDSMHVDTKMHAETLRKESARLHVT